MSEMDVHAATEREAPENEEEAMGIEADIAEQHATLGLGMEEPIASVPFDADEGDVAEQSRVVELDEDDYR